MDYIRKVCPICKEEFFVLDTASEKAEYCNFKCLLESVDKMSEINFIESFDIFERL